MGKQSDTTEETSGAGPMAFWPPPAPGYPANRSPFWTEKPNYTCIIPPGDRTRDLWCIRRIKLRRPGRISILSFSIKNISPLWKSYCESIAVVRFDVSKGNNSNNIFKVWLLWQEGNWPCLRSKLANSSTWQQIVDAFTIPHRPRHDFIDCQLVYKLFRFRCTRARFVYRVSSV